MVQIQTLQLWKLLLSVSQLYAVFSPPERIRREIFTSSKPDVERNAASKHVTQPAHRRETLIREHQKKTPSFQRSSWIKPAIMQFLTWRNFPAAGYTAATISLVRYPCPIFGDGREQLPSRDHFFRISGPTFGVGKGDVGRMVV